jgi:hypothetical protein
VVTSLIARAIIPLLPAVERIPDLKMAGDFGVASLNFST